MPFGNKKCILPYLNSLPVAKMNKVDFIQNIYQFKKPALDFYMKITRDLNL